MLSLPLQPRQGRTLFGYRVPHFLAGALDERFRTAVAGERLQTFLERGPMIVVFAALFGVQLVAVAHHLHLHVVERGLGGVRLTFLAALATTFLEPESLDQR